MKENIEIPFSKAKFALGIVALLSLILIFGYLSLIDLSLYERKWLMMGLILAVLGIVVIVIAMFNTRNRPAIVIDEHGIMDNTKKHNIGPIEWNDIKQISIVRDGFMKVLLIHVHDPEKYLNRLGKVKFKAQDPREDYKRYGTPFNILSSIIKISLPKLEILLKEELEKNKQIEINYERKN